MKNNSISFGTKNINCSKILQSRAIKAAMNIKNEVSKNLLIKPIKQK